jgi:hypothetical protein
MIANVESFVITKLLDLVVDVLDLRHRRKPGIDGFIPRCGSAL